jgi:hypothetical protein
MMTKNGNRDNFLESAVFIVLFFLFIWAFSGISDKPINHDYPFKFASEVASNSVAVIEVQQFHFQNRLIPFFDKSNFKLFNELNQVVSGNSSFHQRIVFLQKAEHLIKPFLIRRVYNQYQYYDADDLPALS